MESLADRAYARPMSELRQTDGSAARDAPWRLCVATALTPRPREREIDDLESNRLRPSLGA